MRARDCVSRKHQRGAVAIIVGLSIFVLLGFLGLVVDLGHLYIAKTELQNLSDAAALSGAKELNGTLAGVNAAVARAEEAANANNFNFRLSSDTVNPFINESHIRIGSCPEDACMVSVAEARANPSGKTFLKVDTGPRTLTTYIVGILGIATTNTYGMAVAGTYISNLAPVAICPPDNTQCATGNCGFMLGASYALGDLNPLGPGTPIWIDPVATSLSMCDGSTPPLLPFACTGVTSIPGTVGATVYTNTGIQNSAVDALNSRFGIYTSASKCQMPTAPPDVNITQFVTADIASKCKAGDLCATTGWMNPPPNSQSVQGSWLNGKFVVSNWNGVTASYTNPTTWPVPGGSTISYPAPTPYEQTSGPYFNGPLASQGGAYKKAGRRVLNMAILDCHAVGGTCRPANILAVGKFFMQRQAQNGGAINVEFAGIIPGGGAAREVRLYR